MRKFAWFMAAVMLLAVFTACGKKKSTSKTTTQNTNETSVSQSENSAVKVKRNENGSLTVNVDLAKCAGKDVSIVIARDRATAVKLGNTDGVLAVEQITLDQNGKGSITLMPSEKADCFVSVNGENVVRVKG